MFFMIDAYRIDYHKDKEYLLYTEDKFCKNLKLMCKCGQSNYNIFYKNQKGMQNQGRPNRNHLICYSKVNKSF